ncbi:MAG: hypothetical protein JW720_02605 [Sedimentisphaerales bacterium]|nr:hypothetical protein [Sedimentisphaerales bacterium]
MITVRCGNCGQSLRVDSKYAGKKGRCPKCKSVLEIREAAGGGGAAQVRAPGEAAGAVAGGKGSTSSSGQSAPRANAAVSQAPARRSPVYSEDGRGVEGLKGILLPGWDETSLFVLSAAVILIISVDADIRGRLAKLMSSMPGILFGAAYIAVYIGGLGLSAYQIFRSRARGEIQQYVMLFFAVLTNGTGAICGGYYWLTHSSAWLIVFPLWNIAVGITLMLMLWFDVLDAGRIRSRQGSLVSAVAGLGVVVGVFFVCSLLVKFNWAITFSICIACASSASGALQRLCQRSFGTS